MDYTKFKKEELVKLAFEQDIKINTLVEEKNILKNELDSLKVTQEGFDSREEELKKSLRDQIKARDEAIVGKRNSEKQALELEQALKNTKILAEEHLKKALEEKDILLNATISSKDKERDNLKKQYDFINGRFDDLAKLFEEYVNAFKDQVKIYEAMSKNNNFVISALETKIKNFNGQ